MKDDKLLNLLQRERTEKQRDNDDDDDDDGGYDDKTKMKTGVEEEEVVTCASFRNFAVENSNSSDQRSDGGDSNFEFVRDHRQMDVSTSSPSYPVFGYDRLQNKRSPDFPSVDDLDSEWGGDNNQVNGFSNPCCLLSPMRFRLPIPSSPSRLERSKCTGILSETAPRKKWSLRDLVFGKSGHGEAKHNNHLMMYTPPSSSPLPTLTTQKKKWKGKGERRRLTFQPNQSKELVPPAIKK
ncbi:hypothetical protein ZOSMA_214G00310 [Zostera marina]|uniref:Uncharacterized protein n=1 Tax=Zostera marina TaxID=29655 RepID=A0A0K9PK48_ZOSMR|nr:hypothetical protein ZOSMA_214G00310 [Zostera marina]